MVCILQKWNLRTKAIKSQVHVEILWQQILTFEPPFFPLKDKLSYLSIEFFSSQGSLTPQVPDYLNWSHSLAIESIDNFIFVLIHCIFELSGLLGFLSFSIPKQGWVEEFPAVK